MAKLAAQGSGVQPLNVEPAFGVAVKLTVAPAAKLPPPLTVPEPLPSWFNRYRLGLT
jgi:hypothetical protein